MARLLAHRNVGQLPTRRNKGCVASLKYVPGAKNAKELLPSVLLNARNDTGSHRLWGKYRTYAIVLPRYRARALVQKQIPSIAGKRLQAPIAWYSVRQQAGNSEILSQKKNRVNLPGAKSLSIDPTSIRSAVVMQCTVPAGTTQSPVRDPRARRGALKLRTKAPASRAGA